MLQCDLLILSDFNLFYGTTAGVSRMNNYAKSISAKIESKVYLISALNFVEHQEMIEVLPHIFTSIEIKEKNSPKGISQIKRNLLFALSVCRWCKKNNVKSILIYPSVDITFEFFLLLLFKLNVRSKIYCELNEVRKYANPIERLSFLSILRWALNTIKYTVSEFFWRFYDGLICISSNIEVYAKKYNNNTIVVPILSDTEVVVSNYENKSDVFKILFTGSISIRKENLLEFFYALVELDKVNKNWSFELCGPSTGSDETLIKKLIEENKIDQKVRFLGTLSHSKTLEMQQQASLLVLSRENNKQNYYGFSTKLSEYAVSGTPILMTKTGVVTSYFRDNYNCFMVDGYSRKDFYKKLISIISTKNEERIIIAQNAYNTANQQFAYANYTDALTSFLKLKG